MKVQINHEIYIFAARWVFYGLLGAAFALLPLYAIYLRCFS